MILIECLPLPRSSLPQEAITVNYGIFPEGIATLKSYK